MGHGFTLLILGLISAVSSAQTYNANSQYGNGIVNSTGQWAQQIGSVGATANRNAANQLFQQALQHEQQGLASLNPGLLAQAYTESQQGMQADDQARHLAQTSLQALNVGETAGNVNLNNYGVTSDQLTDLANGHSPYYAQVSSQLSSFGLSANHSAAVLNTPFGQFQTDGTPGDLTKVGGMLASAFGLSSDGIAAGIQQGLANANAIGQKALADAQQQFGSASRAIASGASASPGAAGTTDAAGLGNDPKGDKTAGTSSPLATAATSASASGNDLSDAELRARQAALDKSRSEMRKQLNQSVGEPSENLFMIVHERYVELDRSGAFLSPMQRVAALPRQ